MHIFGRRSEREADIRLHGSVQDGLAALPASSRPLDAGTRNMLRAVATTVVDETQARRVETLGMDSTSAAAVNLLGREPGLSVGDLAERLDRSHSATVRVVERLEEAGLVRKSRSRSDGRRATLELTPLGNARLASAAEASDGVVDGLLGELTSGERVLLERILNKIVSLVAGGPALGGRACRNCDPRECGVEGCPRERLL